MAFTLDKVVPWGRGFDEYLAMFSLTGEDLGKALLGCGDGPASFNAVLTGRGGRVISVDPLYRFSGEELGRVRVEAMNAFLADYPSGVQEGRYQEASLPALLFAENIFDIALCSHFLFLYSEQLDEDFHLQSIKELCRVAAEARIFPLLELGAERSRHLDQVTARLEQAGYKVTVERVGYEFQRGGNEMPRVASPGGSRVFLSSQTDGQNGRHTIQ